MLVFKPRLFISYSRGDFAVASIIHSELSSDDYVVFLDRDSINVGDVFPERIVGAIKKCDGCIILLSASSVKSEWCKLEAYYVHFYNKPFIPVKIGNSEYDIDSPLRNIQKNVQYVTIDDFSNLEDAMGHIRKSLSVARSKAKARILKTIGFGAVIFLLIISFFVFGIGRINMVIYDRQKKTLLTDIERTNKIYRSSEIEITKQKFNNDREVIAQLLYMENDPGLSDIARINSRILSSSLLQSFALSQRQYFKAIDWQLSKVANNRFVNSSFVSGNISQTEFKNTEFDDVYFNGVNSGKQGVKLSTLEFSNCAFNAVYFDNNNAIDIKFNACRFKGAFLNTTNFGDVIFLSDTSSNSSVISNGQVTFFENCVFQNTNASDPPNTLVLGKEKEMQFIDVIFDGCKFIGLVRPEWFKHCTFDNCFFQSPSVSEQLKKNNFVNKD